jgi:hypothetical protein
MLLEGKEWITPMEAARRLLPGGSPRNHRSRATILLRAAQKGLISKRQGRQIRPVYLCWEELLEFYAASFPVVPAVTDVSVGGVR